MQSHVPVMIVGAGPTGLTMACELARHGISFRIFDKKPERTLTANAVGIQTRTLELLDNIGIVEHFLKIGHPCNGIQIHEDGATLARISLEYLDSAYKFILTLPQSETERLLIEHLASFNYEVERPLELIDLKQETMVVATFQNDAGHIETVTSDWLIACDGANSKVRALSSIDFPGEDLPDQFMVANTQMSSFLSSDKIHTFFDKGSILATIPFGSGNYRIGVNLDQSPRKFLIEKEVKEMVQERSRSAYNINSVSWISPFWIHGKIVKNMRHGRIFLAGDAAHIHSPLGGQGMNTGMQDAYNLAWKLALVIKGKAKLSLLDSYQQERHPVVSQIMKRAERFTKLALLKNSLLITLRNILFKIANQATYSKKISLQLTQLAIRYKNSPIINYTQRLGRKTPRPGERAPDVIINPSVRLYDYLRNTQHDVLLFTGLSPKSNALAKIKELQQWFDKTYPDLIKTHIITERKIYNGDSLIFDGGDAIHHRYNINGPSLYVIRPDNYIAYYSRKLDPNAIGKWLASYLT